MLGGEGRGDVNDVHTYVRPCVSIHPLHMTTQRQHLTGQSLRCMKPTGKSLLESVEKSVFHGVCKQGTDQAVHCVYQVGHTEPHILTACPSLVCLSVAHEADPSSGGPQL